jgi:signal transduction histidine kinase/HAMP domain-containing protein
MKLSLKTKINLGIGLLLVVLAVAVGLSQAALKRGNREMQLILRNNYDSVDYCRGMLQCLDRLRDSRARRSNDPAAAIQEFSAKLALQSRNITEPGEGELTQALAKDWAAYQQELSAKRDLPAGRQASLRDKLWQIADLNLQSMGQMEGHAGQAARRAEGMMATLLIAGVLLGVLLMLFMGRAILQPIRQMTHSVHEVEKGNLDLVVAVQSRDELGQLAEAFNRMASRLREFRRDDHHRLARVEQTTQQAIDSLPDAVAILNALGRVELSNPMAQRVFGLKPGAALDGAGRLPFGEAFRKAMEGATPVRPQGYKDALQVFEAGEERFYLLHCLPVMDEAEAVGATLVLVDVTGLRKLDEVKSGLLSTLAHELRTPLTSLRMATHLLVQGQVGELNAKQEELAAAAFEEAERLHQIVDRFLDLSRLESGRSPLDLKPVAAEELAGQALRQHQSAFASKGVKLELDAAPGLPSVAVDPSRLGHVFSNLLANALRFTPPGGKVRLEAKPAGQGVRFSVRDSGPGISLEHRARVFERFYRVPGQESPGVGLGLAIAREIVELHHGRLSLDCPPEGGCAFHFEIPGAKAPEPSEV